MVDAFNDADNDELRIEIDGNFNELFGTLDDD